MGRGGSDLGGRGGCWLGEEVEQHVGATGLSGRGRAGSCRVDEVKLVVNEDQILVIKGQLRNSRRRGALTEAPREFEEVCNRFHGKP